ncbi:MAG: type IV pilus modification PilV family protein [Bacteroidota bacterium]
MKYVLNLKRESGISLVETLIAFLIIGFVLVAFMGTQSQSHRTVSATQRRSVAVHLAREQLESLKRMDGSSQNRNDPGWIQILSNPTRITPINGVVYTTTTTLIPAIELPVAIQNNVRIIPIRVTVSWPEPEGPAGPVITNISIDTFYHP